MDSRYRGEEWSLLITAGNAYRDSGGTLTTGSTVASMSYDGRGRRIKKAVSNDAGLDSTYVYHHDGDSAIEIRNASGWVLKQHVWGTGYIDELVQVGINQDPENADTALPDAQEENSCERFFWTAQDANYNVLGVVYSTGVLAERYEYTPYGKRTVYSRGWLLADLDDDGAVGASDDAIMDGVYNTTSPTHRADLNGDGKIDIDDVQVFNPAYGSSIAANDPLVHHPRHGSFRGRASAGNPSPLCEAGHQGLLHDEEFDLVYNRARMLVPMQGRFGQRDHFFGGYIDGLSMYESLQSSTVSSVDPFGLFTCEPKLLSPGVTTGTAQGSEFNILTYNWNFTAHMKIEPTDGGVNMSAVGTANEYGWITNAHYQAGVQGFGTVHCVKDGCGCLANYSSQYLGPNPKIDGKVSAHITDTASLNGSQLSLSVAIGVGYSGGSASQVQYSVGPVQVSQMNDTGGVTAGMQRTLAWSCERRD